MKTEDWQSSTRIEGERSIVHAVLCFERFQGIWGFGDLLDLHAFS